MLVTELMDKTQHPTLEEVEAKKYISFISKQAFMNNYKFLIMENIVIQIQDDIAVCDSLMADYFFDVLFVTMYTNLQFSQDGQGEEYDYLFVTGLLKEITINALEDYSILKTYAEEYIKSELDKYNSFQMVLAKQFMEITNTLKATIEKFDKKTLDKLGNSLKGIVDKIQLPKN